MLKEGNHSSKYEGTCKLIQIYYDVPKKASAEDPNVHNVYQTKLTLHAANILCKDVKNNIADSIF